MRRRLNDATVRVLQAMAPFVGHMSGMPRPLSSAGCAAVGDGQTRGWGGMDRAVRTGLHELSHKKKAKFWRKVTSTYPSIVDFLCNPKQLHQVGLVPSGLSIHGPPPPLLL